MEPKVSIIIPIYNTEKYLEECLDSVKNQTLQEWECICVDDGSTDNSKGIVEKYASEDSRFKLFCKENGGQSSARNLGIEKARGHYIYYLDSDDSIDVRAMELLYEKAENEQLDLLLFDVVNEFENERLAEEFFSVFERQNKYATCTGKEMFIQMVEAWDYTVSPCMQFARRSFTMKNNIRFVEGMVYEDNLYTKQCLLEAEKAGHLGETLFRRRIRENSTTTMKMTGYHFWSLFKCYIQFLKDVFNCEDERLINALKIRCAALYGEAKRCYDAIEGKDLDDGTVERLNKLSPTEKMLLFQVGFVFSTIHPFPYESVPQGKKLILYGAGKVGKDYYAQVSETSYCDIVLWVDQNAEKMQKEGLPIYKPCEIAERQYDYVIIAMASRSRVRELRKQLMKQGIPQEKIVWNTLTTKFRKEQEVVKEKR